MLGQDQNTLCRNFYVKANILGTIFQIIVGNIKISMQCFLEALDHAWTLKENSLDGSSASMIRFLFDGFSSTKLIMTI